LKQHYPHLPINIIDRAIETVNTQAALHFEDIAIDIVEEQRGKNLEVIQMILLDHDKRFDERLRKDDTELVNGIRSIPTGILLIILKSTHALWKTS
jgi:hypothetical protein